MKLSKKNGTYMVIICKPIHVLRNAALIIFGARFFLFWSGEGGGRDEVVLHFRSSVMSKVKEIHQVNHVLLRFIKILKNNQTLL